MKRSPLWKISITTTPEAEDAVANLLESATGVFPSSFTNFESETVTLSSYFLKKPIEFPAQRPALSQGIRRLNALGLDAGDCAPKLEKLAAEDWANSWKHHFPPIELGPLLVKPFWSKKVSRKGQAVVVLDPGLSFGTGQHPTTRFCLQQIVARRPAASAQSFLDLGTGSGILAIAAAKLGYSHIHAVDFDPEAIRSARANLSRNRIGKRVRLRRADVATAAFAGRQFDLVCANLISTLLLEERERIAALVAPAGWLVLAGILDREFTPIRQAYSSLGFRLSRTRKEKEWRSGAFLQYNKSDSSD